MTTQKLVGYDALRYAETHDGVAVHKYADPTEGPRLLNLTEAREVAREDPSLLWVVAPAVEPDPTDTEMGWEPSPSVSDDGVSRAFGRATAVVSRDGGVYVWRVGDHSGVEATETDARRRCYQAVAREDCGLAF